MATDTPHIRVAARALIVRSGKLLIQHYHHDNDLWATAPGGGIDRGERLDDGLAREVFEELGIRIKVGKLRYVRELRGTVTRKVFGGLAPDFHQLEHFFEVTAFEGEPHVGSHTDNHATHFSWEPLASLAAANFVPVPLRTRLPADLAAGFPDGAVYLGDA